MTGSLLDVIECFAVTVWSFITLKNACDLTSVASVGPPPNLCRGSLINILQIKSFTGGDKSSGMGGSIFKMRLKFSWKSWYWSLSRINLRINMHLNCIRTLRFLVAYFFRLQQWKERHQWAVRTLGHPHSTSPQPRWAKQNVIKTVHIVTTNLVKFFLIALCLWNYKFIMST